MIEAVETMELPETPTPPAVLKRRLSRHSQRRVAFYDPASRTLALEAGRVQTLTLDGTRASDLLAFCASLPERERPRTLFLCGGDSAATTPEIAWWEEPTAQGWRMDHWYNEADRRTSAYTRDEGQGAVTLDLRMAAPWFGAASDPALCLDAWRSLLRSLRGAFGQQTTLLTTPTMTGRELLEASLPYGLELPALDRETRAFLRGISTQGRIELFPPFTRTVRDLWEVDARWQYAACLAHLPTGPLLRDGGSEYAGYVPGFYQVEASVPVRWNHLGLLPDLATLGTGERVQYPRRPRQRFWSWASSAEVKLALDCGWRLKIHQRILWPETHQRPDLAKTWITKLRELRGLAQRTGTPAAQLTAAAYRQLVLHTVGAWASPDERPEHGKLPLSALLEDPHALPDGAVPHIEGDRVLWSRLVPVEGVALRHQQPQLALTVWGRARARTAAQALTYPLSSLVALRTDGIWTTANPYELALRDDDPRPGAWRVKSYLQGPEFWPTDEAQLIALMRRARGGEDE